MTLQAVLKKFLMSEESKIGAELRKMREDYEPLLPVERKLIGWSLGIGLVLLAVLYLVSRFLPNTHQPM